MLWQSEEAWRAARPRLPIRRAGRRWPALRGGGRSIRLRAHGGCRGRGAYRGAGAHAVSRGTIGGGIRHVRDSTCDGEKTIRPGLP
eukprot:398378-Prymnesium_polylepis.3